MKRILCCAALAALVAGAPALAATPKSAEKTGEIGFGVGHADVGADGIGVDTAQFLGVRGGYHFNDQWQIEGQFATSSEDGDVGGTSVDTSLQLIMVNAVMNFHPRNKDLKPYVMAGIGRADVEVESLGTSASDDSVAYQIGGGTRIYFGKEKRMAFRTDLSLLRETSFDDSTTMTTLTGGITWNLGGR